MPRLICILVFCILTVAMAVETTADWPIVTDKATGIELEFPGEFVPLPPAEGIAFGGQSPDGTAGMAVISSPQATVQSSEDLLADAMTRLSLTQLDPDEREALSAEDCETFQVESGFRQEFTAQREGKPVNGIMQYIVYRGRSVLIIAWCDFAQWEKLDPVLIFSLDTTYIW